MLLLAGMDDLSQKKRRSGLLILLVFALMLVLSATRSHVVASLIAHAPAGSPAEDQGRKTGDTLPIFRGLRN